MFKGLKQEVFQDWAANAGNGKSRLILLSYRLARRAHVRKSVLARPLNMAHKLFTSGVLSVEIPIETQIGAGCRIFHPFAIVINSQAQIGERCILRNSVTVGNVVRNGEATASPIIGNDVELGAGCLVLGPIHVGNGAVVGAGAVVVHDVPPDAVVIGQAAQVLRIKSSEPSFETAEQAREVMPKTR
jgi:putative colanic acid biosynthesis acetyltransferase WcaB